jgi:hypothetical protein
MKMEPSPRLFLHQCLKAFRGLPRTHLSAAYRPVLKGAVDGTRTRARRSFSPSPFALLVSASVRHSWTRAAMSSRQKSGMSGTTEEAWINQDTLYFFMQRMDAGPQQSEE